MPTIAIQFASGDAPTSITLTAVTDPSTGLTPAGLSLPVVWGSAGGSVTFAGRSASYPYTYTLAYADGSSSVEAGSVPGDAAATAAGYYATQADIYAEYGQPQADAWSNLTNNGDAQAGMPTPDVARFQMALDEADAWIDMKFMGSQHVVPLTGRSLLQRARRWARRYAGRSLYQSRGAGEKKSVDYTRYDGLIREAEREMAMIKAGVIRTDGAQRFPAPTAPVGSGSVRGV